MARKTKAQNEEERKTLLENIDERKLKIGELRKQLEELESQQNQEVEQLKPLIEVKEDAIDSVFFGEDWANIPIPDDKYIVVINLSPYKTNVVCGPYNQGKIYELEPGVGKKVAIKFSDLVQFVHYHKKFITEGRVWILSDETNKKLNLVQYQRNVLSEDQIRAILTAQLSTYDLLNLIKSASQVQQKMIFGQIVDMVVKDGEDSFDRLTINRLIKEFDFDFYEKARELANYLEVLDTTQKAFLGQ